MDDPASPSDSPDPFASASAFDEAADADESRDVPPWTEHEDDALDGSPSFAVNMARMWVQQHQKASMLGAFAVGVFVGAMLRK